MDEGCVTVAGNAEGISNNQNRLKTKAKVGNLNKARQTVKYSSHRSLQVFLYLPRLSLQVPSGETFVNCTVQLK